MKAYLTDENEGMSYYSRRVHQRMQLPQVVNSGGDQVFGAIWEGGGDAEKRVVQTGKFTKGLRARLALPLCALYHTKSESGAYA